MKPVILECLFPLVMLSAASDDPYCAVRYKRLCQGKGPHVACQFSDPGPGASCVNYTAIKFNNDMKNFIMHYVNRRRQRIAAGNERVRGGAPLPKPELMMLVEWDRELAFLAQRLADQCHFIHDDCRATVRYPYAGQTVGEVRWRRTGESVEKGAKRAIRRVMDAWWGEKRRVTVQQLTTPFRLAARGAVWGHFSQLCVWGLQGMGCGAVHHGASHPRLLLVCDFSHTNMLGQRTLTPGPMAHCPIHTMRKQRSQFPLLCAPIRHTAITEPEQAYEEDDDLDPGLTVELGDVPTPRIHYSEEDWLKSKGVLVKKLDREPEMRYRVGATSSVGKQFYREWITRQPDVGVWRVREQNVHEVLPLQRQTAGRRDTNLAVYYKPTVSLQENVPRYRWKQTRHRPIRPGANALLITQPEKYPNRQSVSLMLDRDDVDQLFRDTGFRPSCKKDK